MSSKPTPNIGMRTSWPSRKSSRSSAAHLDEEALGAPYRQSLLQRIGEDRAALRPDPGALRKGIAERPLAPGDARHAGAARIVGELHCFRAHPLRALCRVARTGSGSPRAARVPRPPARQAAAHGVERLHAAAAHPGADLRRRPASALHRSNPGNPVRSEGSRDLLSSGQEHRQHRGRRQHQAHARRDSNAPHPGEGQLLGNHSFSHPVLPSLDAEALAKEIESTNQLLEHVAQIPTVMFRAPYGARNQGILSALETRKLKSIMWNIDSEDWADPIPAVDRGSRPRAGREAEARHRAVPRYPRADRGSAAAGPEGAQGRRLSIRELERQQIRGRRRDAGEPEASHRQRGSRRLHRTARAGPS